jgi:hypothetical protein
MRETLENRLRKLTNIWLRSSSLFSNHHHFLSKIFTSSKEQSSALQTSPIHLAGIVDRQHHFSISKTAYVNQSLLAKPSLDDKHDNWTSLYVAPHNPLSKSHARVPLFSPRACQHFNLPPLVFASPCLLGLEVWSCTCSCPSMTWDPFFSSLGDGN